MLKVWGRGGGGGGSINLTDFLSVEKDNSRFFVVFFNIHYQQAF